jgi:uncharacterized protein YukE
VSDRAGMTTIGLASDIGSALTDATDALHQLHSLVADVIDEWQRAAGDDTPDYQRARGYEADAFNKILETLDHVRRAARDAKEIAQRGSP